MFKKHTEYQTTLFGTPVYSSKAKNLLEDDKAWQNQFYENVTCNIDDTVFAVMFESNTGRPVSDIRTMVAMRILKEGMGCSDQVLFEQCRFSVLFRRALGLYSLDDPIPGESSYYRFYALVSKYYFEKGINLFDEEFKKITKEQILKYKIPGKVVRMDSKLIGSNIASYPRYKIVHSTLAKYFKNHSLNVSSLDNELQSKLLGLLKEDVDKTVYESDAQSIRDRMLYLGILINEIMKAPDFDKAGDSLLVRVFNEQYTVNEEGTVEVIPSSEVSARSVQNPNDPDASYRNKRGTKVKGYTHNLTETCDTDTCKSATGDVVKKPGLIVDVQTETASTQDADMYQTGILGAESVTGNQVETALCDGGFYTPANEEFAQENKTEPVFTGFQGKNHKYDLEYDAKNDNLEVTDAATGENIPATKTKSKGQKAWRIDVTDKDDKVSRRYFTMDNIKGTLRRKAVENLPLATRHLRNNVEAAMFQLSVYLRNNKTRYRGKIKESIFSLARSLWVNCVRLRKFEVRMAR